MEVKLDKRYPVRASPEQAWAVLADIRATAACMPGATITEERDATHFKGSVKSKVGPAVMSFGGDLEILALDTPRKAMTMLGKGADKTGSSASMNLAAHIEPGDTPASCVLVGVATIIVSGKLAQFGSRLLVPVSDAMLAQFAGNFNTAAAAVPASMSAATSPATSSEKSTGNTALPAAATAPKPVKELNALALMWTVFKGWLAGLFGKAH
jgi:uncharacterized protein